MLEKRPTTKVALWCWRPPAEPMARQLREVTCTTWARAPPMGRPRPGTALNALGASEGPQALSGKFLASSLLGEFPTQVATLFVH